MLHSKCKISAEDIINAAKASIGNDNDYLSFSFLQAIKTLNFIQSKIDNYDQMIKYYIDMLNTKITTIPGIGYTTAGLILKEIGDITRFKHVDKLISFSGLDLEVYDLWKFSVSNLKISKKGSKYLRYALYQVAKVCWRFVPSLNTYYKKKESEHKHSFVILGHIEKKIVRIIYSILKSCNAYTPR